MTVCGRIASPVTTRTEVLESHGRVVLRATLVRVSADLLRRWLAAEHLAAVAARQLTERAWGVLGREDAEEREFTALVDAYSALSRDAEDAYRAWQEAEVTAALGSMPEDQPFSHLPPEGTHLTN